MGAEYKAQNREVAAARSRGARGERRPAPPGRASGGGCGPARQAGGLCGPAVELLRAAQIESIVVTNTVYLPPEKRLGKITQLTVAPLLAAAIERIHSGESVGALFQ